MNAVNRDVIVGKVLSCNKWVVGYLAYVYSGIRELYGQRRRGGQNYMGGGGGHNCL